MSDEQKHNESQVVPEENYRAERTMAPEATPSPTVATQPVVVPPTPEPEEPDAEAQLQQMTRRSLLIAATVTIGGLLGLKAFNEFAPRDETGLKLVFRNAHQFNEGVARTLFFSPQHRAQEFPRSAAIKPRNNYHGETPIIDLTAWRLNLSGLMDGDKQLTLTDLQDLPFVEETTELKCVEGWSAVVNWGGYRFADFARKFAPPEGTGYVAMRSEPEGYEEDFYYVGLDLPACLHPQTLLATHMNGQPLTEEHGVPLRLVMPHKYGIKNIKLITHIAYHKDRPADYWAERGYDYYAGL